MSKFFKSAQADQLSKNVQRNLVKSAYFNSYSKICVK